MFIISTLPLSLSLNFLPLHTLIELDVYAGFLFSLQATNETDVRMQMRLSLADKVIYIEDHSEAKQTCQFCLKKRAEWVKYQKDHVWNNKRDVTFPFLHMHPLSNAFPLKHFNNTD